MNPAHAHRCSSAVRLFAPIAAAAVIAACAGAPARPEAGVEPAAGRGITATADRAVDAVAGLPAGDGRELLRRACTGCHDLGGLWAYQGYYDEARWRGLVDTMIAHGADLNET